MSGNGLITVESPHSVADTVENLKEVIIEAGFKIPAIVNHGASAGKAGKELRPTVLILFGNPNVGTNFMTANQTIGIDLPQKFLVWEDEFGQTNVTYNDPKYLSERHNIDGLNEMFSKVAGALVNLANEGTN